MPPVRPGRARGCSCSSCAWRRRGGRCWPSVSVPVSRWLLRRFPRGSVRSGMAKRDDSGGGRGSPLPALPVAQQPLGDEGPGGQEEQRAWGHGQAPPGHGLARGRGQRWHRWQRTPPHRHCSGVPVTSPSSVHPWQCPHGCPSPDLPQLCPHIPVGCRAGRGTAGPPPARPSAPTHLWSECRAWLCLPLQDRRGLGVQLGLAPPASPGEREGTAGEARQGSEGAAGPGAQRLWE